LSYGDKWAELLNDSVPRRRFGLQTDATVLQLLQERLANQFPIDKLVQEFLLGSQWWYFENAANEHYQMETDPLKVSRMSPSFHGDADSMRAVSTTNPSDRWTMDDY